MAACVTTNPEWEWKTQLYVEQERNEWPSKGKYILAQYDDEGVVVQQAYCPEIAEYMLPRTKGTHCRLAETSIIFEK